MKKTKKSYHLFLLCLCISILSACGPDTPLEAKQDMTSETKQDTAPTQEKSLRDSTPKVRIPEATGTEVFEASQVIVDVSNASDGYFMVKYTGSVPKVRVQITAPDGTKNQPLLTIDGDYQTFPLAGGDGTYQINILENTTGSSYAILLSETITVTLSDAYSPFLYPNQYVDYDESTKAVALGSDLAKDAGSDLDVIKNIYNYVIKNITYDYDKAATVKDGYAPVIDETLSTKKGICFDYAALMTAMMRTQGIPTRLDIGYSGEIKHAWISAYTPETGWIDKIIEFDGKSWTLMDPTFASTSSAKSAQKYIGDGSNYTLQYSY